MSNTADTVGPDGAVDPIEAPEPGDSTVADGPDPAASDPVIDAAADTAQGPDQGPDEPTTPLDDGQPADDQEPARPAGPLLEMRQVAGLTAGSITDLDLGSFQFQESESEVGFAVRVNGPNQVIVVPGTVVAHVDEIPLTEPTPLHHSVLNVGTACFTVRRPRPEPSSRQRMADLDEATRPQGAIAVPDLRIGPDDEPTQTASARFGTLFSRSADEEPTSFDPAWWAFLDTIRETRTQVAERHRLLHPDPEELRSRVRRLDPGSGIAPLAIRCSVGWPWPTPPSPGSPGSTTPTGSRPSSTTRSGR